ncbi:tetratricopeptide repeat protein [Noviherbaspirillum humi]|uniref:tetratricopeptide repeat protein n=1 Tax=Noviherbaspirillum humi TaxID=1688639 RepID=UPI001160ADBF|nr:hypothetical protein [Noviherbaspirillum humi]
MPDSDQQVLERLPFRPNDPIARELSDLRARLKANPNDIDSAIRLARRYYGLVGEEGDPRYLGYAEAALAPWWNLNPPPEAVQILRASIRQFRHDFTGSLADLDAVLARNPRNAEARILRAIIHIVQARYPQAAADCAALDGLVSPVVSAGCGAMVDGLTGKAAAAYDRLTTVLDQHPEASPSDKLWANIRLGELAWRLENTKLAERHFRQALSYDITDGFLLAAYADLMLDQKRAAEVLRLLKNRERSDVLLLRIVMAEQALDLPTAKEKADAMEARFVASQMRGENVHQQEEARFHLYVRKNPKKALELARENWTVQLEPRDARIYLEAALAANDPAAAAPVVGWVESSHIEDRYLQDLARRLKGGRK